MTVVIQHSEYAVPEDELDDADALETATSRSLLRLTEPASPENERPFPTRTIPLPRSFIDSTQKP
jgi:hypothetical protein